MSSDEQKPDNPETQDDSCETTILDFLAKEIAASAGSIHDQNNQPDDLDALVSNLLKEVITATDELEIPQEAKPEDLDALFADMLSAQEVESQAEVRKEFLETGSSLGRIREENNLTDQGSINLPLTMVTVPSEESTIPAHAEPPVLLVSTEAIQSSPCPPAREAMQDHPSPDDAIEKSERNTDRTPAFVFSSQQPAPSGRRVVVIGAFLCLLASIGVGVYRFEGSSSKESEVPRTRPASSAPLNTNMTAPPQSSPDLRTEAKDFLVQSAIMNAGQQGMPEVSDTGYTRGNAAPTIPMKVDAAAPAQDSPKTEAKTPPVQPANLIRDRGTPAVADTGKSLSNPPARDENPALTRSPDTPAPANATTGAAAPNAAEDKTATPAVPAATENAAPAPALPAQARSESPLTQPVSGATLDREGAARVSKPPVAPVPTPSAVTPAVLISQVSPSYPEVARRMRISGTVVLDVEIDAQGKVVNVKTVSGLSMLASAAEDAVLRWRFKPASVNGTNVPEQRRVSVVFKNP